MHSIRHSASAALSVIVASALLATPLFAQSPRGIRANGVIERVDGTHLKLKTAAGERDVNLTPDATVTAVVKGKLTDLKPGVFVGVGAQPQPDGTQQAIRVVIFPESMRGLGEGHRPWDKPGTTMTNATVDTSVTSVDGQTLNVKYKGGEKKIAVRPDAVIITYVPSDKSELKPGVTVTVNGTAAGNAIESNRITVARDGVVL